MTIELKHDDHVRLPGWRADFAKVSTLTGYCSKNNADRARLQGQPEAWTVFAGTVIVNDMAYHRERQQKFAEARIIQDDMTVIIEGRKYMVRVRQGNAKSPRMSDPIAFEPVVDANLQEAVS